ncbi:hypothetical protein PAPYR_8244 [Paratrimastix pyriformis]|uniref:Uncharacterized protein n=1 Tax=Paratrimastix pyriformis TaxID=342808 RepID=A0ABQ8UB28_9EUKA|nr:hypothetical protein PAPYR_8244 [Paratrimastix pyriformis]
MTSAQPSSEKVMLVLSVEGAKNRRVPFFRNSGFESLKSMLAREYAPDSIAEISYSLTNGDVFAIAGDDSLEGYLEEIPLPHLKVSLAAAPPLPAAAALTAAPPTAHSDLPTVAETLLLGEITNLRVGAETTNGIAEQPPEPQQLPARATATETQTAAAAAIVAAPPAAAPESAQPLGASDDAMQTPAEPTPSGGETAPPEPSLPPLAMCTLQLEAIGLPPRTVEITSDQADSMRFDDFKRLLAAQFEGRTLAGAPAIGPASGAVTGLVDSEEALHQLLRDSLARPVVLQVPLQQAEQKKQQKTKRKKHKEQPHPADEPQQAAVGVGLGARQREVAGGVPVGSRARRVRRLLDEFATPVDIADPKTGRLLSEVIDLVHGQEKNAAELAGVVAPLARLLAAVPTNLPTIDPVLAALVFAAIASLAVHAENRLAFLRAHVAHPLVRLLSANLDPPIIRLGTVVFELVGTIANLSIDPEDSFYFRQTGVAAPLVKLLIANTNLLANPVAAERFLTACHNISADPVNKASFGPEVAAPIVRLLKATPDLFAINPIVAAVFLGVIANLSTPGDSVGVAFGRAGVALPLARLLTTARPDLPTTSSDLALELLRACANLLMTDPTSMATFGSAGVAGPLVGMLTAHPNLPVTHPEVAEQLLRVAFMLSMDPRNRTSLAPARPCLLHFRTLPAPLIIGGLSDAILKAL